MPSVLRIVMALCTTVIVLGAAASAQAQTCAERKERMVVYLAEAKLARDREAQFAGMNTLAGQQLSDRLKGNISKIASQNTQIARYKAAPYPDPSLYAHLERSNAQLEAENRWIVASINARRIGAAGPEHPQVRFWRARREQVATNIAHSRAAMESMGCDKVATVPAAKPKPVAAKPPVVLPPLPRGAPQIPTASAKPQKPAYASAQRSAPPVDGGQEACCSWTDETGRRQCDIIPVRRCTGFVRQGVCIAATGACQ